MEGPHGEEMDRDAWALTLSEDKLHKYNVSSQQENSSVPALIEHGM